MTSKFKFDKCANHYYSGCENKPETKHGHKEMCLKCFSESIYEDLCFGIKYGKYKNAFKLTKKTAFEKTSTSGKMIHK